MTLQISDLADIVAGTLSAYGPPTWTDLTSDLQEYHALPNILKKEKVEDDDGKSVTRFVLKDKQHNARAVGMFSEDNVAVNDALDSITMNWRHVETSYLFDLHEEAVQGTAKKLVDVIKGRRHGAMVDAADLMETAMWELPSSDDGKTPLGYPYWAVPHITGTSDTAGGGFNGSTVFTSTYPGGLNNVRWRNWTAKYTNVTQNDLITKMRRAWLKCRFKSPIPHKGYDQGKSRYIIATTTDTLLSIEDRARDQQEDLGPDIGSTGGEVVFKGRPIRAIPKYDDIAAYTATVLPVDFIDWAVLYPVFLRGWNGKETTVPHAMNRHNCVGVFVDWTYVIMCHDRRRLARICKAAS